VTLDARDLGLLRCPAKTPLPCLGALAEAGATLVCARCGATWPVVDGLARLYRDDLVRGNDRLLRFVYDRFAALHDPAVRWLIPVLQTEGSEAAMRDAYLRRLALDALRPRADRPLRILEVGAGTGANLAAVRDRLPRGLDVEYWAMDLSEGMLAALRERLARDPRIAPGDGRVRLAMADAHALPYPDGAFDRVFHTGGIGGYRDPRAALAEMARVAAPGTPIVVVDEQLDPSRTHSIYHRAVFRAVTFYDRDPHCPRELVPAGSVEVIEEQASRFFYCLSFKTPG
jgi:ubiquinone/menaquinone biosynthesis C-methylase UbiE/uncharacterized protein YbaR (Trm112 family)